MKKNKPYKLGQIAAEIQRLNMLNGTYPEAMQTRKPKRRRITPSRGGFDYHPTKGFSRKPRPSAGRFLMHIEMKVKRVKTRKHY